MSMDTTNIDIMDQAFNLTGLNGENIPARTADFHQLKHVTVTSSIIFATQLGLSFGVLATLLLTADLTKRRAPTLYLNAAALVCNIIRCGLTCAFQDSDLTDFVITSIGDFHTPGVRRAQAISIAGTIFNLLLFLFIEASLVVQVKAIFSGMGRTYRYAALAFVSVVALIAIAWRINLVIANVTVTVHLDDITLAMLAAQTWAQFVANITSVISIGISSLVFATKAAQAIHKRHKMGLRQFGALQIVFLFSCQTLTLPVVFAAVAYFALPGAQLQSFVETIVALFLPLSSIWSSANIKAQVRANHPRALLELPSQHGRTQSPRGSRASDITLTAAAVSIERPGEELAGPARREKSFWAQYRSRDSIMLDDLDISGTATRPRQVLGTSALHGDVSCETGDVENAWTSAR